MTYTVLLSDIGGDLGAAEPDAAFLALPSADADWYVSYNGAGFVLQETTAWPWASVLVDFAGHQGETCQVKVVLDSGVEALSNVLTVPGP